MSKIIYLQCPTGISGDMCLGALVSLGVPIEYLTTKLNALGIENEYRLRMELVHRNGQEATKLHVDLIEHHHHDDDTHKKHKHHQEHHHRRHLPEIEAMILGAKLPGRAEKWSLAVFRQLAVAEGAVHGIAPEKVHFHEVGAVDAIVDIVGTCLCLDWLDISSNEQDLPLLYCSPLPTGGGTVRAAHGLMAVPVPAVLKLWEMRGCPVYSNGIDKELVTPTGAAIATTLVQQFISPPAMTIKQIGLGAGNLNLTIPNILQAWLGLTSDSNQSNQTKTSPYIEKISVLETQIDDLNPQAIGFLYDALFEVGALDVFTQAIGMKKSRPAILLTVICNLDKCDRIQEVLFRETTTLGIRTSIQERTTLKREMQTIQTEFGSVKVKIAWQGEDMNKTITNIQPEYEDCAELARKQNIPWREVHRIALQTWHQKHNQ
ncbi:nickel pincer cofactor biosynthesis protein LarC [Brunnivagina elsteri]|uniref:Putative nickel insertion protein n=1 Tax=Brunnivagina elsteri CCALA 953 TaxID=987040 RepID=A0A2A2TCQ4_9CYAN|nr:nickel pincer cofactor biosynthesis protein LarC [Calothrix elsteri]PAX51587.1 TIGR00299 family protein [Calothrix elsteri CCALA 953]